MDRPIDGTLVIETLEDGTERKFRTDGGTPSGGPWSAGLVSVGSGERDVREVTADDFGDGGRFRLENVPPVPS